MANTEKMKIRTIKGVVLELKKIDPDCAVTEYFIRKLCQEDKIPHQMAGSKYLINMEDVYKMFFGDN